MKALGIRSPFARPSSLLQGHKIKPFCKAKFPFAGTQENTFASMQGLIFTVRNQFLTSMNMFEVEAQPEPPKDFFWHFVRRSPIQTCMWCPTMVSPLYVLTYLGLRNAACSTMCATQWNLGVVFHAMLPSEMESLLHFA